MPGLNHCRALSARPPIIPTTALPGLKIPSVFGPTNVAPFALAAAAISIASQTGTRSGTSTVSLIPASMAAIAASFTPAAGTNSTEISIFPRAFTASCGESNTGTPSTVCPPLPGVTPATTFVPYSRIKRVRAWPSRPVMPCTRTRLVSSIRIAILVCSSCQPFGQLNVHMSVSTRQDLQSQQRTGSAHAQIRAHQIRCARY